jgi:glycosyltransferase involved in cell wall biosynthesis
MTIQNIIELFASDGREFITNAYRNLLGRDPDEQGLSYYLGRLSMGAKKSTIIYQLASSPECKQTDKIKGLKQLMSDEKRSLSWPFSWINFFRCKQKTTHNNLYDKIDALLTQNHLLGKNYKFGQSDSPEEIAVYQRKNEALDAKLWELESKQRFITAIIEGITKNQVISSSKINAIKALDLPVRFSIVINTLNRAHTIEATLDSLQYLRYPLFEVIIVNGPSTDGTSAIIEKYNSIYKIGNCPEPNLSMSRNIGIAMSSGDIVCFIDDDAIPEPNWLCELAKTYQKNPLASAVGGYIRNNTGYDYQCKSVVCDRFGDSYGFNTIEDALKNINENPDRFIVFTGTNCSFRRDALLEIGGFNEEYAYFLDETDVEIRLHDAQHLAYYSPSAEIHHKYASSHLRDAEKIPKTIYVSVRSKIYFVIKYAFKSSWCEGLLDYILKYRSDLFAAYNWYYDNSKIDLQHRDNLLTEVDKGIHDGLYDAFSGKAIYINSELLKKHSSEFKDVKVKLPENQRLKICMFVIDYPPCGNGGISKWTHDLAMGMAKLGHEITVITNSNTNFHAVDFVDGVWVHRVPIINHEPRSPSLIDLPNSLKDICYSFYDELIRVNDIRGIDVVSAPIWDVLGAAVLQSKSFPVVTSLHTTYKLALPFKPEWMNNKGYLSNHVNPVIKYEEILLSNSTRILANSRAIVSDIKFNYNAIAINDNIISIVPHGVRIPSKNGRAIRTKDIVRVLFVGRLERRKGIDLFLDSLSSLYLKFPNLEVNIVGDASINFDENGPIIKNYILNVLPAEFHSRFIIHGVVSEDELNSIYSNCDIFVAPSRYESFGLIYIEAMSRGIPSIGCAVGGVPEVIDDGVNGLLMKNCTSSELYTALDILISNEKMRAKMGEMASRKVNNQFSLSAMVEGCLGVYRQAVYDWLYVKSN